MPPLKEYYCGFNMSDTIYNIRRKLTRPNSWERTRPCLQAIQPALTKDFIVEAGRQGCLRSQENRA